MLAVRLRLGIEMKNERRRESIPVPVNEPAVGPSSPKPSIRAVDGEQKRLLPQAVEDS
jgi:hypothetical protein